MKSNIFYLRPVAPPIRLEDLPSMFAHARGCFGLHRVEWRMSFLSADGSEMLCWYRAPDAESARIALHQLGANMDGVWPGRLEPPLDRSTAGTLEEASALAVVPDPIEPELLDSIVKDVESRGGVLISRIISLDGLRTISLFRSAEAGVVSAAFRVPQIPNVDVWACRVFDPDITPPRDIISP